MTAAFLQNWASPPRVTTEWLTDRIASASDLAEERRNLVGRPRRTVWMRWSAIDRPEAQRLLFRAMQAGSEEIDVPIYPDVAFTTAASSGTTINCPTADRRFHVGGNAVIVELQAGRPTNPQVREITAVGASTISVTPALIGSYAAGSPVFPSIVAEVQLDSAISAVTDQAGEFDVPFTEKLASALPEYSSYAGVAAHGFAVADDGSGNDYYVLIRRPNWGSSITIGVARSGNSEPFGRDRAVFVRGPRPLFGFRFSVASRDRAEFAAVLAFFDGHRGRAIPFFVLNPITAWEAEAIATTFVEVPQDDDIANLQDFASYVVVETASDVYVRPITNVAVQGSNYRITVGVNFPVLNLADIVRTSLAHLCRFASDGLEEDWASDSAVVCEFSVEEIVAEDSAQMSNSTYVEPDCEA